MNNLIYILVSFIYDAMEIMGVFESIKNKRKKK